MYKRFLEFLLTIVEAEKSMEHRGILHLRRNALRNEQAGQCH